MTEEEARAWIAQNFTVPRETWAQLETYVTLLKDEMSRQNLIAESTRNSIWSRHIVDSAQLLLNGSAVTRERWADLGAGAGLPGIVIAILSQAQVSLVENRKKRIDFLTAVVERCNLDRASVIGSRVEGWNPAEPVSHISARAYAPLSRLLESAIHLSRSKTLWLLPKGRNWQNEVASAQALWHFTFHVKQSVTDDESAVLLLRSVSRKGAEKKGQRRK